jgi:4-amino-4-deoxy-L-arabinose transferase-like glycosyltransferase
MFPPSSKRLGLVIVLAPLLLQLFLRMHHITAQGAYVDEGVHSMRGATVWKLDANPGRASDGKFLLYYYLGLFEAESTTALFASRAAIALFSLISGAAMYLFGRRFHSHTAGLVALGLYAVLPFTFFYERMALADPFAVGFACLVAWRSLAFGRCPRWRDGLILGVLLALSTMAKLTLGLLPLLPVMASIIYFPQLPGTLADRVRWWLRCYFPPLALAAVIMIGLWLPILIPALQAYGTPQQFALLDSMVIAPSGPNSTGPLAYIAATLHDGMEYVGAAFYAAVALAMAYLLLKRKFVLDTFFLIFWVASTTFLTFGFASIVAPRYVLPAVGPLILVVSIALADLWQQRRLWLRAGLVVAGGAWLITFALPFLYVGMTNPARLPLTGANYSYYLGGTFNADDTTIQAARLLDNRDPLIALDPSVKVVYGDWVVCRLVYYTMRRPVTCLLENIYKRQLADFVRADLAPGESAYLIMVDTGPSPMGVEGVCPTPFVKYTHANTFSLVVWRLQREPCDAAAK